MPSRGSYQVASREEGKAAQRDESYKSCIIALLIFFFLCMILLIACLPWKRKDTVYPEYHDETSETAQHHYGERTKTTTTSTTESTDVITEKYINIEQEQHFDRYLNNATEETEVPVTTTPKIEITTEQFDSYSNNATTPNELEEVETTTISESELFADKSATESFVKETKGSTTNIEFTTINAETTEESTNFTKSIENESVVSSSSESPLEDNNFNVTTEAYTDNSITETASSEFENTSSSSTSILEEYRTSTESLVEFTSRPEESTTIRTTDESSIKTTEESTTITVTSTGSYQTAPIEYTTPKYTENSTVDTCYTGDCKQIASKMLFYMNHTADPCEDFYEYACGGFESNPQTIDENLENVAYERIYRQMQIDNYSNGPSLFSKYYDSCMKYENVQLSERIRLARGVLGRVGKFYTTADWTENQTNFTELLAKLLLHHSALLFDVAPDLNEHAPKLFTLKIGPTTYRNPFDTDETEDSCYAKDLQREESKVDLGKLYKEYKTCKNNTKTFLKSIKEALGALGVFNKLNNTYNVSQYVDTTVINIDMEVIKKFYANYPPKNKIREAYLMKNYTDVTIPELEKTCKIINWTQLVHSLIGLQIRPQVKVQVYFYDSLIQGLKNLEEFSKRDAMQLNNALLGLYARDLYQQLVLSKHRNVKQHCLRVASNLLIPEASSLYISSFRDYELTYMNNSVHEIFNELKETLKLKLNEAEWAVEEGRNALTAKINDLKVAVPDISYFTDENSTYKRYAADKVYLTGNYFENSMVLIRRYRTLIYAVFSRNPSHSEQVWTHYATPFQSKGLAIYGLNLVVIPFGVIDWSTRRTESSFDYLLLATLGNVIAHEIAHHFDANGIYYWNGTRDAEYSLLNENSITNSNFKDYINCQRNVLYQTPMNMELPYTMQNVSYEISQLTLNERLSETMGLRLAYDTLDRLRSQKETILPWLKLDFNQLFYLTYAQMHCTKLSLTSSYVSLYEDEQLPSRIRVFVTASNNKLFGEAWNCPEGSRIMPSFTCSIFPYLESNDVSSVTVTRK